MRQYNDGVRALGRQFADLKGKAHHLVAAVEQHRQSQFARLPAKADRKFPVWMERIMGRMQLYSTNRIFSAAVFQEIDRFLPKPGIHPQKHHEPLFVWLDGIPQPPAACHVRPGKV